MDEVLKTIGGEGAVDARTTNLRGLLGDKQRIKNLDDVCGFELGAQAAVPARLFERAPCVCEEWTLKKSGGGRKAPLKSCSQLPIKPLPPATHTLPKTSAQKTSVAAHGEVARRRLQPAHGGLARRARRREAASASAGGAAECSGR